MMKFKMKQTALLIVLLLSIGWIKADAMNENRIHCVVLNTQGNPIPFANVMVFKSLKDSIPSNILSADNQGNFKLDIDVPIWLKVSCMGYETESLIIRNVDSLKSATYRVSWEFTCKTTKILLLYIFLGHNRNIVNTKFPYPIKRLEVIRRFNQKSMAFNQSLS